MTLLHQAAQKAVERIRHTLMTGLAHNDAIAALSEIVAMLPQHPDPETRPSMSMFASAADYNAAMDEWLTPPALQHQEVPREPVALTDKQIQDAVFAVLRKWNTDRAWERYTRESGPYDVSSLRPEVLEIIRAVLAASPSTTRQQEVGSEPALLFDGYYVYSEGLTDRAKQRTSPENVADVLDAVVRLMRAAPSTPENAGGVPAVAPAQPLNGVAATVYHDEGAYAQCGACGRYTLDPMALSARPRACECGEKLGWCGSFKKPGPNAKWSNHFTPADGVQEVVSQTPPPLGTDGGTPQ